MARTQHARLPIACTLSSWRHLVARTQHARLPIAVHSQLLAAPRGPHATRAPAQRSALSAPGGTSWPARSTRACPAQCTLSSWRHFVARTQHARLPSALLVAPRGPHAARAPAQRSALSAPGGTSWPACSTRACPAQCTLSSWRHLVARTQHARLPSAVHSQLLAAPRGPHAARAPAQRSALSAPGGTSWPARSTRACPAQCTLSSWRHLVARTQHARLPSAVHPQLLAAPRGPHAARAQHARLPSAVHPQLLAAPRGPHAARAPAQRSAPSAPGGTSWPARSTRACPAQCTLSSWRHLVARTQHARLPSAVHSQLLAAPRGPHAARAPAQRSALSAPGGTSWPARSTRACPAQCTLSSWRHLVARTQHARLPSAVHSQLLAAPRGPHAARAPAHRSALSAPGGTSWPARSTRACPAQCTLSSWLHLVARTQHARLPIAVRPQLLAAPRGPHAARAPAHRSAPSAPGGTSWPARSTRACPSQCALSSWRHLVARTQHARLPIAVRPQLLAAPRGPHAARAPAHRSALLAPGGTSWPARSTRACPSQCALSSWRHLVARTQHARLPIAVRSQLLAAPRGPHAARAPAQRSALSAPGGTSWPARSTRACPAQCTLSSWRHLVARTQHARLPSAVHSQLLAAPRGPHAARAPAQRSALSAPGGTSWPARSTRACPAQCTLSSWRHLVARTQHARLPSAVHSQLLAAPRGPHAARAPAQRSALSAPGGTSWPARSTRACPAQCTLSSWRHLVARTQHARLPSAVHSQLLAAPRGPHAARAPAQRSALSAPGGTSWPARSTRACPAQCTLSSWRHLVARTQHARLPSAVHSQLLAAPRGPHAARAPAQRSALSAPGGTSWPARSTRACPAQCTLSSWRHLVARTQHARLPSAVHSQLLAAPRGPHAARAPAHRSALSAPGGTSWHLVARTQHARLPIAVRPQLLAAPRGPHAARAPAHRSALLAPGGTSWPARSTRACPSQCALSSWRHLVARTQHARLPIALLAAPRGPHAARAPAHRSALLAPGGTSWPARSTRACPSQCALSSWRHLVARTQHARLPSAVHSQLLAAPRGPHAARAPAQRSALSAPGGTSWPARSTRACPAQCTLSSWRHLVARTQHARLPSAVHSQLLAAPRGPHAARVPAQRSALSAPGGTSWPARSTRACPAQCTLSSWRHLVARTQHARLPSAVHSQLLAAPRGPHAARAPAQRSALSAPGGTSWPARSTRACPAQCTLSSWRHLVARTQHARLPIAVHSQLLAAPRGTSWPARSTRACPSQCALSSWRHLVARTQHAHLPIAVRS
ncbi:uncharacterized protein LOC126335632 [Schistocerca gregaria]|uniref:uncharacterized protein LOC126335632 n=1 Tax=Schistocerca gregaria TaxID=7010 RepID=UPI00211E9771|nr:uncharacterized protein LOC126335632 [Schistocerca gregaria]